MINEATEFEKNTGRKKELCVSPDSEDNDARATSSGRHRKRAGDDNKLPAIESASATRSSGSRRPSSSSGSGGAVEQLPSVGSPLAGRRTESSPHFPVGTTPAEAYHIWMRKKEEQKKREELHKRGLLHKKLEHERAARKHDEDAEPLRREREKGWDLHIVVLPTKQAVHPPLALVVNAANPEVLVDLEATAKDSFNPLAASSKPASPATPGKLIPLESVYVMSCK
eukprot:m51a1_g13172 hypothetical protein (226) ;mRNA; r:83912-84935